MREENNLYKSAQEQLNNYVRSHELRDSAVRNTVLLHVCRLPQPFIASQLEEACKPERISSATIYNALHLFIEAHLLSVTPRGDGLSVNEYELVTPVSRSHMFIVCRKCGRRVPFNNKGITRMTMVHKYANFIQHNFTLVVYGECKVCRRLRVKQEKKL